MDKMLGKLLEKKKSEKPMDDMYKKSKMSMLQSLKDEMNGMMKGDLEASKMKKVEVAAPDAEGLEEGLETAQDLVKGGMPEGEEEMKPADHVEEMAEAASPEELDEMIAKLEALKAKKSMF